MLFFIVFVVYVRQCRENNEKQCKNFHYAHGHHPLFGILEGTQFCIHFFTNLKYFIIILCILYKIKS